MDKVTGKGLSTNDFTGSYKTKLDNMESTIATAVGNLQLIEVVNALPTTDIKNNRLYLVPNTTALTENLYDVYIRVNNKWEKIDSLEFDIANYPTKTEMNTALSGKVDKVTGKGLSTNDFTAAYKTKLDNLDTNLNAKVDKVTGKGLSTEDYTSAEKTKLSGIATGANKTVVDSSFVNNSTNPVQSKVIKDALDTKMESTDFTTVTLSVTFEDDSTATYQLLKYIGS